MGQFESAYAPTDTFLPGAPIGAAPTVTNVQVTQDTSRTYKSDPNIMDVVNRMATLNPDLIVSPLVRQGAFRPVIWNQPIGDEFFRTPVNPPSVINLPIANKPARAVESILELYPNVSIIGKDISRHITPGPLLFGSRNASY